MDVQGIKPYPVFNALQGHGHEAATLHVPRPGAERLPGRRRSSRNQWVVDHDATLVTHRRPPASGRPVDRPQRHARRRDQAHLPLARELLRARAAPSRGTSRCRRRPPNWKVNVKKGDILSTNATYDTTKASWYEVMGIMVVGITKRRRRAASTRSPGTVDQTDYLTHGRLKENIDPPARARRTPASATRSALRQGPFSLEGRHQELPLQPGRPVAARASAACRRRSARASR